MKIKSRVFLRGYSVAIVTFHVGNMITTCWPIIVHLLDATFKDTNEKVWWYRFIKELVLKNKQTVLSHLKVKKNWL